MLVSDIPTGLIYYLISSSQFEATVHPLNKNDKHFVEKRQIP